MQKLTGLRLDTIADFLAKLAEKSESVYWLSSPDFTKIAYISPAYEKIWGRSREDLYKNPELWITYLHPDNVKTYHPIHAMVEKIEKLGPEARYEENYCILRPDGEARWILDRGFPIYGEDGKCYGVTGVAVDVTSEKLIEQALLEAKKKAEAIAEARANFLAVVSHELRTPLNAILGFGQELKRVKSPAKQREYINDVLSGGRHLLALVNDILDFSKLESGKLDLLYEPFNLHECLDKTVHTLTHLIVDKPIKLDVKFSRDLPRFVLGDAMRLKQVVINLLGNAIKFTHKGSIKLSAKPILQTKKKCIVRIEIQDTGIGIPEDKLESVFEKFSQVDASRTRKYGGTGLGLPICKMIVEKMGGKIALQSKEGRGTQFTIEIPFKPPGDFKVVNCVEETKPLSRGQVKNIKSGTRVLMVEDNLANQKVALSMLSELPIKVDKALEAKTALNLFSKNKYSLILTDIGLPEMDGNALIAEIRKINKEIPIVALSAYAFENDKKESLEAGANAVLTKPLDREELINQVAFCLSGSTLARKKIEKPTKKIPAKNKINSLPIFVPEDGIKSYQTKQDLAELIVIVRRDTPGFLDYLSKKHHESDRKIFLDVVHKHKGGLVYVSVPKLYEVVYELEKQIKTGVSLKVMKKQIASVIKISKQTDELLLAWLKKENFDSLPVPGQNDPM